MCDITPKTSSNRWWRTVAAVLAIVLTTACGTTATVRNRGSTRADELEQTNPGPKDSQASGPGALGRRGGSGESSGAGTGR
jgi:hypothetical protein